MFIDISGKLIVIVGGGKIAERRAETLGKFGCEIKIISPEFTENLSEMTNVCRIKRTFQRGDCEGAFMVLAATDDEIVNMQVIKEAKACGALANASHNKELCDFYFPGILTQGENVVVGVTASGHDHSKAAHIRKQIARIIDGETK